MKDKIKQVREYEKLSQRAFGLRIGISGPSVARLESGENNPSDQTIKLICSEFGINPDWMAGVDGADMKLSSDDSDLAAVLRAMSGRSEPKKKLLRIIAEMPDDLLEAVYDHFKTKKEPPQA